MARRPSKYLINLTDPEHQALEGLVRNGKTEHRLADQVRMILWAAAGVTIAETQRRLGCSEQIVLNWRRDFLARREGEGPIEALKDRPRSGRPPDFSPEQQVQAKAIACEKPNERDEPLSRYSLADIVLIMKREVIVPTISRSTLCRWYKRDALKPWRYHTWLFPHDRDFEAKASVVLDLYHGLWQGQSLGPDDYVLSADEKCGLQILARCHPTRPPIPEHYDQVEFEYERLGTWAYQAALDVFHGTVIGQIEAKNNILTFNQLVEQVMSQPPYNTARRVFWIVDNGSAHHPATFRERLTTLHEHAIAVHLPTHANWLNQIELYFSILQRKALPPRDFNSRQAMADRILAFQAVSRLRPNPSAGVSWPMTCIAACNC